MCEKNCETQPADPSEQWPSELEEGHREPPFSKESASNAHHLFKNTTCSTREHKTKPTNGVSWFTGWRSDHGEIIWIVLVLAVGIIASTAFGVIGIRGAKNDQELRFQKRASDLTHAVQSTWIDYVTAALWVHEGCRGSRDNANSPGGTDFCSREDFFELHEYITAGGLDFQVVIFAPYVTHEQRAALEEEASEFYRQNYPHLNYTGFQQFAGGVPTYEFQFERRDDQEFYVPNHYVQPVKGNEYRIDFDLNTHPMFTDGLWSWQPLAVGPFLSSSFNSHTHMMVIHPGVPVSEQEQNSTGVAMVNVHFAGLMEQSVIGETNNGLTVFVFVKNMEDDQYTHFGTASFDSHNENKTDGDNNEGLVGGNVVRYGEPEDIEKVRSRHETGLFHEEAWQMQGRTFSIIVTSDVSTFNREMTYIILGTVLIAVACIAIAVCLSQRVRRMKKISAIKAATESERTALIIHNAQEATQKEREMNEYLSHEVRNPLTASMCAAHNLSLLAKGLKPGCCSSAEDLQTIEDDIDVIQSSLTHVNDLLRSILDMHKAASDQLKIDLAPTEILKDVFEPVKAIVYRPNDDYDIQIDCPADLVVLSDRLRLKQIVLNLAVNSKKFIQKGFIRMRATVVEGQVEVSVEDTGPGIPKDKRLRLFSRFQESLDSLSQGTGMGLALSKNLAEIMGCDLVLDDIFDSGVEGCPGARFVLRLNVSPVDPNTLSISPESAPSSQSIDESKGEKALVYTPASIKLPEALTILIVDDDMIVRKMLSRSLKRLAQSWKIQEASNGETAIQLAARESFDLIFLDMYMASVEKQLLGTETAQSLRVNGCKSCICGLSANEMEDAFLKAGANAFMLKPFPCDSDALKAEIVRILGVGLSNPGESSA